MLGKLVKKHRIEAGLTQKQLADKAGVTQQCISKYEKGGVSYDYHTTQSIFEALELEWEVRKKRRDSSGRDQSSRADACRGCSR